MKLKQLNRYTWVQGKGGIEERFRKHEREKEERKESFLSERKYRKAGEQLQLYKAFVEEVFEDRAYCNFTEFNKKICQRFNSSSTYYRTRMIELKLIQEKNKLITPLKTAPHEP